jgi:hypothetical protein
VGWRNAPPISTASASSPRPWREKLHLRGGLARPTRCCKSYVPEIVHAFTPLRRHHSHANFRRALGRYSPPRPARRRLLRSALGSIYRRDIATTQLWSGDAHRHHKINIFANLSGDATREATEGLEEGLVFQTPVAPAPRVRLHARCWRPPAFVSRATAGGRGGITGRGPQSPARATFLRVVRGRSGPDHSCGDTCFVLSQMSSIGGPASATMLKGVGGASYTFPQRS